MVARWRNGAFGVQSAPWAKGAGAPAWALLLVVLCMGCRTQRWPAPMTPMSDPLPAGSDSGTGAGLEDVVVVRHSDPVQVRRAGASGAFPMRFHSKRERVTSGAWVYCGTGGKAELIWPKEGLSVMLFDEGSVRVGERERGEPVVRLFAVSRANFDLLPGTVIELPGGALFEGDPERRSGPFVLQRIRENVLRLKNQSKGVGSVRYRDEVLRLSPGQIVDLPLMGMGTGPLPFAGAPLRIERGPLVLALDGPLTLAEGEPGVLVEAEGRGTVQGLGLTVRLEAGQSAHFVPLGKKASSSSPTHTGAASPVVANPGIDTPKAGAAAPAPAPPALPPMPTSTLEDPPPGGVRRP